MTVFWFRRDLRIGDNAGLYYALQQGDVLPLFIFDKVILDQLEEPADTRVSFIHDTIRNMAQSIGNHGGDLQVRYGAPLDIFRRLIESFPVERVYTNVDYEPYATRRDESIARFLKSRNIEFKQFKDQVIFEKSEIVKEDGQPYLVYTPYKNKWRSALTAKMLEPYSTEAHFEGFANRKQTKIPSLEEMGFKHTEYKIPAAQIRTDKIKGYGKVRDLPGLDATSRLGIHLRFGTISIRKLVKKAREEDETYLEELIWREFFMMILWHHPHVVTQSFRPAYDHIPWRNNEYEFDRWCAGKTGFPMVDAGMRQLNQTGFMHNRVRMITANFLTKLLLTDWRWGEAYFAQKLLDYELASNNGNWQWAAGSGCDAAPYFRIFNPESQREKFDPNLEYIRRWVPEYGSQGYPRPMINYKEARERALQVYEKTLKEHR